MKAAQLAPIALFIYKRPYHAQQTIEHLQLNPEFSASQLFVFCDGAKSEKDVPQVEAARAAIRQYNLPNVVMYEQPCNLGLANSIISGVSQLCVQFGRVIVLEDDLLVSRGFLSYMNRALEKYQDVTNIMQISGHVFPFPKASNNKADAFFLPITGTTGWATWQRAWDYFDKDCVGYAQLKHDRTLRRQFDLNNCYPYSKMMFKCLAGQQDVWGIKWWWSVFKQKGLCVYPHVSLINNLGFDQLSTNTKGSDTFYNDPAWSIHRYITKLPDQIEIDQANYTMLQKYIRANYGSLSSRAKRQVSKLINQFNTKVKQQLS